MLEQFGRWARVSRACVAMTVVSLLAACGGGGGGSGGGGDATLRVSLDYADSAWLFQPSLVQPKLSGLEGRTPTCTLQSGSVPPGMQLHSDCSVSGTPTAAGSFSFGLRLGASGVSNQVDLNTGITVFGPSLVYSIPARLELGQAVDIPLLNVFWRPRPDNTVTYSVVEGALPTGVTVDPTTGRLLGAATAEGGFHFRLGVTVKAPSGVATMRQEFPEYVSVGGLTLRYLDADSAVGWLGLPFKATVHGMQPGASYSFGWAVNDTPPPGLQLDPATGTLSGTPEVALERTFGITVTMTRQGQSVSTSLPLRLHLMPPVYLDYQCNPGWVGTPYECSPTYINNSGQPLPGVVPRYSLVEGLFSPGITLDPWTGVISGTPTGPMNMNNVYGVELTLNGVHFKVLSGATSFHVDN